MMRIAYCEDEPAQAALVRALMERWGVRRQEPVEVVLFESAEEFMFKNEDFPNIVVTVDLLTTGIDVDRIVNLVFMRRIRSRILFDQMLGRLRGNRRRYLSKSFVRCRLTRP